MRELVFGIPFLSNLESKKCELAKYFDRMEIRKRLTVAVSPPPTMTVVPEAAAATAASKRVLVPLEKLSNSKTPGGLLTVNTNSDHI